MLLRQLSFSMLLVFMVKGVEISVSAAVLHDYIWNMIFFLLMLGLLMSVVAWVMLTKKPLWGVQILLSLVVFHFLATLTYLSILIFWVVKYDPYFVATFFVLFIFSTVFEIWQIVRILQPNSKG